MADAWVYHGRSTREQARALVEELRAGDEFALVKPAGTRDYRGEIHEGDVVYHDGSRRDLVWANERAGVECRQFAGSEMARETRPSRSAAEASPEADDEAESEPGTPQDAPATPAAPAAPVERVEQSGSWFTAYRDDEKVGTSQRSEADAWALLRGQA